MLIHRFKGMKRKTFSPLESMKLSGQTKNSYRKYILLKEANTFFHEPTLKTSINKAILELLVSCISNTSRWWEFYLQFKYDMIFFSYQQKHFLNNQQLKILGSYNSIKFIPSVNLSCTLLISKISCDIS